MTHRNETGSVLITSVIAILVVASLSAALLSSVAVENNLSLSNDDLVTGDFLADGAAEIAEKVVLRSVVNFAELPREVVQYDINGHTIEFSIKRAGPHWVEYDPDGVRVLNQPVLIKAWTTVNGYRREVNRLINVGVTPLFQFTVFYDGDLEILPFPNMTISGRIHTNRDLYLGSDNTLSLDSRYVHAVGEVYRRRKDIGLPSAGTVRVRSNSSGNMETMDSKFELMLQGIASESGFDSSFLGYDRNGDGDYIDSGELSPWVVEAMERWGGSVQSSVHGLRELVAPDVRSIKRFVETDSGTGGDYEYDENTGTYYEVTPGTGTHRKGHYHGLADIVVMDGELYDADGTPLMVPPGVLVEKQMYDAREGKDIYVTEIDLAALAAAGMWPVNGLIYAARTDASPDQPNGIRLTNGETLSDELTVVSEDPVFIHGDYNVSDKKGAAVIGDAVSVLSSNWDDSKTSGTLPFASPTQVMASIITGSYATSEGNYNGGFENMIRFHENWTGVNCTILGSFVNVFDSEIATGRWVYGSDHYLAPDREFDFDSDYRQVSNLPPFTPIVARVRNIAWFEGKDFDEEIIEVEIEP